MTRASRFLTGLVTCFATHAAVPRAPAIVVLRDNDQIHHARAGGDVIAHHPGVHLRSGARCSPHDNPAERIWAALKTFPASSPAPPHLAPPTVLPATVDVRGLTGERHLWCVRLVRVDCWFLSAGAPGW